MEEDLNKIVKKKEKNNIIRSFIIIAIMFSLINVCIVILGQVYGDKIKKIYSYEENVKQEEKKFAFSDIDSNKVKVAIDTNMEVVDKPGYANIIKQVNNSIVGITTNTTVRDWFDTEYTQEGGGSGIIFNITDDKLMIVTNYHVIENADKVSVRLVDEVCVDAQLVGSDPETDLAVIYVEKKDIKSEVLDKLVKAKFGDSTKLEVGDIAIAIGNPMGGKETNTATSGMISAVNRELVVSDKKFNLIQTDAAINPGNSGGGLINHKGEIIGINTVKLVDTRVEGIGFAIPSNSAKPIIEELVNNGNIARPFIGIVGSNIDANKADLWEIPLGVLVRNVMDGGSAFEAGIQPGDIIIEFDGRKISSMDDLLEIVKQHKPGDKVSIKYIRNQSKKIVKKITLQDKSKFNSK